ncbi:hypothetical protein EB796_001873 [Bugula neritina]|uniref:acid phosphatase n=1 Tax=Bugula neritina TaxID=10212 RepID=A0A7J7KNV1_BUGNE|nr:hypothetical protein EB796_001873 [Bugula neritina]
MYNSTELHKLDGGPVLTDIGKKFGEYVAGNRSVTYNIYSAHDTTVSAVLTALQISDAKQPEYTATVMVELHKSAGDAQGHEVKVFYKPITDNSFIVEKNLPGCPSPCKLEDFLQYVKRFEISDWDKECGNNVPTTPAPPSTDSLGLTHQEKITIIACSTVVVVFCLILLIMFVRKRSSRSMAPYLSLGPGE